MDNDTENTEETVEPKMIQVRNTAELQEDIDAIKKHGHDKVSDIMKVSFRRYRRFLENTEVIQDLKISVSPEL